MARFSTSFPTTGQDSVGIMHVQEAPDGLGWAGAFIWDGCESNQPSEARSKLLGLRRWVWAGGWNGVAEDLFLRGSAIGHEYTFFVETRLGAAEDVGKGGPTLSFSLDLVNSTD